MSMSLSMYQASIPAFVQMLNNLAAILDKAEADVGNRKMDPEVLLNYRLAPDILRHCGVDWESVISLEPFDRECGGGTCRPTSIVVTNAASHLSEPKPSLS